MTLDQISACPGLLARLFPCYFIRIELPPVIRLAIDQSEVSSND